MSLNIYEETAAGAAERIIGMILAISRKLRRVDNEARNGVVPYPYPEKMRNQRELEGKNLLLIGFDKVAGKVAIKAEGLDMNVRALDKDVSGEEMEALGVSKVENSAEGLAWADYVSIHVEYDGEKVICEEQLKQMKSSGYLINMYSTGLVDSNALYRALEAGDIEGAAVNLFNDEENSALRLLKALDNVLHTSVCIESENILQLFTYSR